MINQWTPGGDISGEIAWPWGVLDQDPEPGDESTTTTSTTTTSTSTTSTSTTAAVTTTTTAAETTTTAEVTTTTEAVTTTTAAVTTTTAAVTTTTTVAATTTTAAGTTTTTSAGTTTTAAATSTTTAVLTTTSTTAAGTTTTAPGGRYMAEWTENQSLHSSASLASGATAQDAIDLATGNHDLAVITLSFTGGATTGANLVAWLLPSTDDGTTYDTMPKAEDIFKIKDLKPLEVKRISVTCLYPRVRVWVRNDGPGAVTYASWYALRKFVPG